MLSTNTETIIVTVTRTIVKSMYLPMRGIAKDVGGMLEATYRRNMRRQLRRFIPMVIFSLV